MGKFGLMTVRKCFYFGFQDLKKYDSWHFTRSLQHSQKPQFYLYHSSQAQTSWIYSLSPSAANREADWPWNHPTHKALRQTNNAVPTGGGQDKTSETWHLKSKRCSCPADERVKQNRWAQLKGQWTPSCVPFVFYQQMRTKASAAALNNQTPSKELELCARRRRRVWVRI